MLGRMLIYLMFASVPALTYGALISLWDVDTGIFLGGVLFLLGLHVCWSSH